MTNGIVHLCNRSLFQPRRQQRAVARGAQHGLLLNTNYLRTSRGRLHRWSCVPTSRRRRTRLCRAAVCSGPYSVVPMYNTRPSLTPSELVKNPPPLTRVIYSSVVQYLFPPFAFLLLVERLSCRSVNLAPPACTQMYVLKRRVFTIYRVRITSIRRLVVVYIVCIVESIGSMGVLAERENVSSKCFVASRRAVLYLYIQEPIWVHVEGAGQSQQSKLQY